MEGRIGKIKNETTNNKHTIMKTDKIKNIVMNLIKVLKWLYTLLSKK